MREMVMAEMVPLVEAQISNAEGIRYLVARNKKSDKLYLGH
jgi:hypothetical protein